MRAIMPVMAKTASTESPAMTQTLENSVICPSLSARSELIETCFSPSKPFCKGGPNEDKLLGLFTCKLVPPADVGNSLLIATDHNFNALFDRRTVFAASTGAATRTLLLEDDFAGAVRPDRNAHAPDGALLAVIPLIQLPVAAFHKTRHEAENRPSGDQTGSHSNAQTGECDEA